MVGNALCALEALPADGWLALDTETTGLGRWDEVIEIALLDAAGRTVLETLVRPGRPVTAKTTALHGLRGEDLSDAPPWSRVWPPVEHACRGRVVVAWNAAFDQRLVRQSCARYGLPARPPRFLCLREAFRVRHPLTRGTLDAACLALGLPIRPSHRARPDAEVARRVALALGAGKDPRSADDGSTL